MHAQPGNRMLYRMLSFVMSVTIALSALGAPTQAAAQDQGPSAPDVLVDQESLLRQDAPEAAGTTAGLVDDSAAVADAGAQDDAAGNADSAGLVLENDRGTDDGLQVVSGPGAADDQGADGGREAADGQGADGAADDDQLELVDGPAISLVGESNEAVVAQSEAPRIEADDTQSDDKASSLSDDVPTVVQANESTVTLRGRARVLGGTWAEWSAAKGNVVLGDEATALSGIRLALNAPGETDGIRYRVHVSKRGWLDWKTGSSAAGLASQDIQAVRIELTGGIAKTHDVWYRARVRGKGWLGWTKNGLLAGSEGLGRAIVGLKVRVVAKGAKAPTAGDAFMDAGLVGQAHVQSVGWQPAKKGYDIVLGTSGRGLRMESIKINRPANEDLSGSIVYKAHVQSIGWQQSVRDGQLAGTEGAGLRIEALRVKLTGGLAKRYDVWYRLHVQTVGWLGWATNWNPAGTEGMSLRVESIQVALVPKGAGRPSSKTASATSTAFLSVKGSRFASMTNGSWLDWRSPGKTSGTTGTSTPVQAVRMEGMLKYRVKTVGGSWSGWCINGAMAGDAGSKVEALRVRLSDAGAKCMDVWYRAHVSGLGWLGWTKNGSTAGSDGLGLQVEAYQIKLLPKGSAAPGSTTHPRAFPVSGDAELDRILNTIYLRTGTKGVGSLKKAHYYIAGSDFRYIKQNVWPAGDWRVWSKEYAKEFWNNKGGNCYRYASIGCWLAIGMGFDANVYCGQLNTTSAGLSPHGWVEVHYGGTVYVVDPELQQDLPIRSFFWNLYSTAPVIYYTPQGVELT